MVWHSHLWQRLGVHRVRLTYKSVFRQDKCGQRVYFVVGQRPRLLPRHASTNEVEQRRRIGPKVGDGLHCCRYVGDFAAAKQRRKTKFVLAILAVASEALFRVNLLALRRRPAAGRETGTVWHNANVPRRDVVGADWRAKIGPFGERHAATQDER